MSKKRKDGDAGNKATVKKKSDKLQKNKSSGREQKARSNPKRAVELVDVVAKIIRYSVNGNELFVLKRDFELCEMGQEKQTPVSKVRKVSVEFGSHLSKTAVIGALESILAEIKQCGLPRSIRRMEGPDADLLIQLQSDYARISTWLETLPPSLRAEVERTFNETTTAGSPSL